jgi:hypothetical protein
MTDSTARSWVAIAVIALASCAAFAVDPPDLRFNAQSGLIETVDSTWSGSEYNVRYTVATGDGEQFTSVLLSTNAANDLDPRIVLSSAGDACVAWWRDRTPNTIVYRKHDFATGVWSAERPVGLSTESNSRPRLAYNAGRIWAAYQIQSAKCRNVGAQIIDDDPEPVRSIIASTTYTGDLDIQLVSDSGHLWVSWIDTNRRVGYSEFQYEKQLWSAPLFESFSTDTPAAARARIRGRVIGS